MERKRHYWSLHDERGLKQEEARHCWNHQESQQEIKSETSSARNRAYSHDTQDYVQAFNDLNLADKNSNPFREVESRYGKKGDLFALEHPPRVVKLKEAKPAIDYATLINCANPFESDSEYEPEWEWLNDLDLQELHYATWRNAKRNKFK